MDHSDTTLRLGFVTDIFHDELNRGKKAEAGDRVKEEKLPKECGSCGVLKPAGVHKCPSCGFAPEKISEIAPESGELEELSKTQRRHNRNESPEAKKRFYGELLGYCQQNGKKAGYAAHIYKAKFGVFPNSHKSAEVLYPGHETLSYIRSRNIAYSKRRTA